MLQNAAHTQFAKDQAGGTANEPAKEKLKPPPGMSMFEEMAWRKKQKAQAAQPRPAGAAAKGPSRKPAPAQPRKPPTPPSQSGTSDGIKPADRPAESGGQTKAAAAMPPLPPPPPPPPGFALAAADIDAATPDLPPVSADSAPRPMFPPPPPALATTPRPAAQKPTPAAPALSKPGRGIVEDVTDD